MVAVVGMAKKKAPYQWIIDNAFNRSREGGCWTDLPWVATSGGRYPVATGPDGRQVKASHLMMALDGRPRPSSKYVVMHSCDTPRCLNPRHLSWGSQMDNIADMKCKGRARNRPARGEANAKAVLNSIEVLEIRRLVASGEMQKDMATRFGVSKTCVSEVVRRRTWAHV